jgi:hypothetical protein
MDDLFNNLFDIFTREIVASYDLQTARRNRNVQIPEFHTNQNILNNARIIRQEFENRQRGTFNDDVIRRGTFNDDVTRRGTFNDDVIRRGTFNDDVTEFWDTLRTSQVTNVEQDGLISTVTENIMSSFRDGIMNIIDNLENDLNLNFEFEDFEDVKVTLTDVQFNNNINTTINILDDDTCNICLDILNNKEDNGIPVSLKCNHRFHNNCIKEWLTKKSLKCPMCRYECERL